MKRGRSGSVSTLVCRLPVAATPASRRGDAAIFGPDLDASRQRDAGVAATKPAQTKGRDGAAAPPFFVPRFLSPVFCPRFLSLLPPKAVRSFLRPAPGT